MDCHDARKLLQAADALHVSDAEVEAALRHAEGCSVCASFLERDRRVAQLIRDSVPRATAPLGLKGRLHTALDREYADSPLRRASRSHRRWLAGTAVAAAALALVIGGRWLLLDHAPEYPAARFAEDYIRRAAAEERIETSDPEQVAAFFGRELGLAMAPPQVPGFALRNAVVCVLDGRRGGAVEYESQAGKLTYYVIPLNPGEGPDQPGGVHALHVEQANQGVPSMAAEGVEVATWWDARHQHALVGAWPGRRLQELAPLFACPTRRL